MSAVPSSSQGPSLSRTTTGNTAYYSFANTSTTTVQPTTSPTTYEQPAMPATAVANTEAPATTTTRAPTADPSPEYAQNGAGPMVDEKLPIANEKVPETAGGPSGTTDTSALTKAEEAGVPATTGVASPTSDATPTSPTSLSKEEQLQQHAVGTFASGAAIPNPTSDPNATLHSRTVTADAQLSDAARSKITKAEGKNAKQMAKIVQGEAKAQQATLKSSVTELSRMQKIQKEAAAAEAKALTRHTKALAAEQKLANKFNQLKAQYEAAQAELASATQNLETTRTHSQQQTEALKTKTMEVEQATAQKAADDREREIKIAELKAVQANAPKSTFGCF